MIEDKNSYTNIIKAISLFGGVKVFQIIISIIRSKIIALLIGPTGMGISSLFSMSIDMISSLSGCGLEVSAVRDISRAHQSNNQEIIATTVSVVRKLVFLLGCIGAIFAFIISPWMSQVSFGNYEYTLHFRVLSVMILFNQLNIGQTVLLQGTFHYKYLAKASLFGNFLGLFFTIPFYYYFGEKGIVPALIVSSVITLFLSYIYARKLSFPLNKISYKIAWSRGKLMISLGVVLAISGLLTRFSGYIVNIVISHFGEVSDVGLYSAGYHIANTYVFLILSSMATDYVPRISAISNDMHQVKEAVNKQNILLITLLSPIIILFVLLMKELLILLYSEDFLSIVKMVELFMLGMFFRAVCWTLSYMIIAIGESKTFFKIEFIICIFSILTNSLCFILFGLTGLGFSFIANNVIYLVVLFFVCKKRYDFHFTPECLKACIPQFVLCAISISAMFLLNSSIWHYLVGSFFLLLSLLCSYKNLVSRVNVSRVFNQMRNRLISK